MLSNMDITPTDIAKLLQANPLACEQLKAIVLQRLLDAAEAKLAEAGKSE